LASLECFDVCGSDSYAATGQPDMSNAAVANPIIDQRRAALETHGDLLDGHALCHIASQPMGWASDASMARATAITHTHSDTGARGVIQHGALHRSASASQATIFRRSMRCSTVSIAGLRV
jgi:hypothetical protein